MISRFIKNNLKTILVAVATAIICIGGTVLATGYWAKDISYTREGSNIKTVQDALNDLYNKNGNKTPKQVATLNTQGASYTMQNDGYIIGTATPTNGKVGILNIDNKKIILTNETNDTRDVSVYVSKNTVVTTRTDAGIYNLTVYEWK